MLRAMDKWLPGYLASLRRRPRAATGPCHVMFCVVDHFEPLQRTILTDGTPTGGNEPAEAAREVAAWCQRYGQQVAEIRDEDGVCPQHTFFYPAEEYAEACLAPLAAMTARRQGEVEIHIHHRNDTPENLENSLAAFRDTLRHQHGLLGTAAELPAYGFVHGNWALCNARPDGDWCGVDDELAILQRTGCYADFTFPSAPSPTQPRLVNAIYYARDRGRPRGADEGRLVEVGQSTTCAPDELLLITGPLALNWRARKFGVLPRLENAELSGANPPSLARFDLWRQQHISVQGRPDWVVVKLHTHGYIPANRQMLLGETYAAFHRALIAHVARTPDLHLHYVTARECANIVKAAAAGESGTPHDYRNYHIAPPPLAG